MVLDLDYGSQIYDGGEICVWEGIDSVMINMFDLEAMANTHRYGKFLNIWYRNTQTMFDFELIQLKGDASIRHMAQIAMLNGGEVELFFEQHPHCKPLAMIKDEDAVVQEPRQNDDGY